MNRRKGGVPPTSPNGYTRVNVDEIAAAPRWMPLGHCSAGQQGPEVRTGAAAIGSNRWRHQIHLGRSSCFHQHDARKHKAGTKDLREGQRLA
jgi:hypothetical protein